VSFGTMSTTKAALFPFPRYKYQLVVSMSELGLWVEFYGSPRGNLRDADVDSWHTIRPSPSLLISSTCKEYLRPRHGVLPQLLLVVCLGDRLLWCLNGACRVSKITGNGQLVVVE
jgi:hypothetical protein